MNNAIYFLQILVLSPHFQVKAYRTPLLLTYSGNWTLVELIKYDYD